MKSIMPDVVVDVLGDVVDVGETLFSAVPDVVPCLQTLHVEKLTGSRSACQIHRRPYTGKTEGKTETVFTALSVLPAATVVVYPFFSLCSPSLNAQ